jgi:hypothetical protein
MSGEHEGRLFGCQTQLENDVLRYNSRLDYLVLLDAMQPHMRMVFEDGSKITWVLMETHKDQMKIAGLEFSQMTFDVSFPRDCLSYALSRLRCVSPR